MYQYEDNLESERLITRFVNRNDVRDWSEFFKDPVSTQYFPSSFFASHEDPSETWINRQLKRYAENRYGLQALIDKQSGQLVGQCGLLVQEVDGVAELEVGYHILTRYRGLGFAPEAAKRFIDYAFANRLSDSVISIIDTRNAPSCRVAEKNGLQREKTTYWSGIEVFIYRIRSR